MTDTLRGIIARALQEAAMAPNRDQPLRLMNWTATAYAAAALAAIEASGFVLVPLKPTALAAQPPTPGNGKEPRFIAAAVRHYIDVLKAAQWHIGDEERFWINNDLPLYESIASILEQDRWPENRLVHPLTGDTHVVSTRTGRIIETRAAPQLGDAERRIKAKRGQNWLYAALEMIGDSERTDHDLAKLIVENETDLLALIEQLDAAQSALADIVTESTRREDAARLRSPTATATATGEEQAQARDVVEAFPSYTFDRAHTETLAKEVASALAAARAQGERDERERVMHILTEWLPALTAAGQGHSLSAIIDEVRALAAPEPQEEKHDG